MAHPPDTMQTTSTSKGIGFVGKVYSDGSYGYCRAKKTDRMGTEDFRHKYLSTQRELEGLYTKEEYQAATLARLAWKERSDLGSSKVTNSHKQPQTRAKRGSKGLTSHGRKRVFGGVSFIEWRVGKHNCSFLTLTLPPFPPELNPTIASVWSELIRQITQYIRRRLTNASLLNWIAGAHEIQEQRFRRDGTLALHFHCVFQGRRHGRDWEITPEEIRGAWRSIVSNQLPMLSDSDWRACERLEMVRRTASGYLAKYLSKGLRDMGDVESASRQCLPSSWYSISRALGQLLNSCVRTSGDAISTALNAPPEASFYHRSVRATVSEGREIIVGAYGKFKPGWSQFVPPPVHPSVPLAVAPSVCGRIPKKSHDGFGFMF